MENYQEIPENIIEKMEIIQSLAEGILDEVAEFVYLSPPPPQQNDSQE